jgi:hypothetical protein
MVPLTRGSTMIWRSIITAIARVTASMSALTKFTVTCAPERMAAALLERAGRCACAGAGGGATDGCGKGANGCAAGAGCCGTGCGRAAGACCDGWGCCAKASAAASISVAPAAALAGPADGRQGLARSPRGFMVIRSK